MNQKDFFQVLVEEWKANFGTWRKETEKYVQTLNIGCRETNFYIHQVANWK